jgi:outer membrane protein assembly factor BamB
MTVSRTSRSSAPAVLAFVLALALPSGRAAAAWPMFQGDARHTGRSGAIGPLADNLQWQFMVIGTPGSPAVAPDGTVYLPTGMPSIDAGGLLYAINPDGTQKWRVPLAGPPGSTAPAVGLDGTVYVHVNGPTAVMAVETLHALDPADGSTKWTFEFGGGGPVPVSFVQSAPTVGPTGRIHVGSQDGSLWVLDPATGDVVWSVSPSVSTISSSPAVLADGTVYLHDHTGLFAYGDDGTPQWNLPINVPGGTGSPSVGADGTVYFVHVNNGTLYAVNPDSTIKWAKILGAFPVSTPAVGANAIYVGADGLRAYSPSGTELWQFNDTVFSSASPVVGQDGTIYWRASSHLFAVKPDGSLRWDRTIPLQSLPGLEQTPAIGPDGTLYLAVDDPLDPLGQRLLALRTCPADCDDGNPCTADACDPAVGCVHPAADDGAACDDQTVCNGHETCVAGACVPGTPLTCVDTDPCTTNACNPVTGCNFPPAPDGTACPNTTVCDGAETCQSGVCSPGTPLDCDDHNACTTDACNPVSGCTHTAIAGCTPCQTAANCGDGNFCTTDECVAGICRHSNLANNTPCPDADLCNGTETCQGGFCVPGPAPSCDDQEPCTVDSCDPATGCKHAPVANGTSCADGNVCNGAETCQAGACASGTPLACGDGNPCTIDSCDATLGCQNKAVPNNTPCADANPCNGTETCQAGACTSGTPLDCTDGNPCTQDSCDPQVGCRNENLPNGSSCADATVCNGAETCLAGVCVPGAVLVCDDGKPCTTDSCNDVSGCINAPIPGCTACNDASDCDDNNPCTTDQCVDGGCRNTLRSDGSSCSDNDACNGVEVCQGGECQPGTPLVCDDGNPCTSDTCDPLLGCQTTVVPDGTACPDGDLCNGDETCLSGSCVSGPFLDCDDQNPCTTDACDAALGCVRTDVTDGTACLDATVCNGTETCQAGVCTGGTAIECDDGNACTTDACNAISGCSHTPIPGCESCTVAANCNDLNPCTDDTCVDGVCQNTPVADGFPCSDGNICNGAERCMQGACTGAPQPSCDDGNVCTHDFCDPFSGCQHSAVANGASCADGDVCDGDETCRQGACSGGAALACDDHNPCTTDTCDPLGGCGHAAVPDGSPCPDGTVCNGDEVCSQGTCVAGAPPTCDDGNPCTDDACDPVTGCVFPAVPDETPCADDTVCNGAEVCRQGACAPGQAPDCDDQDPCTVDACDPVAGCTTTPLQGLDAVSCALASDLTAGPCGGKVPRTIRRRVKRARKLVARAQTAPARRANALLGKAARELRRAARLAERMAPRRLSQECADSLRTVFLNARALLSGPVR